MVDWSRWRRRTRASATIHADVTVHGDVGGQLAVGNNIVQMRVDRVLGNLVTVLPRGTVPRVTPRAAVRLLPRRPTPMLDRQAESAVVVEELVAGRAVDVHGPAGMGKSTLLRHTAHGVEGGVVHLSARGMSEADLLQALFEAFYDTDLPLRPGPGQLRHLLQPVRAALLVDDADLPDDAVADLADHLPGCGLALTGAGPRWAAGVRSLSLPGLPWPEAARLLVRALGRPPAEDERSAVAALVQLAGGAPGRIIQFATAAAAAGGSLADFAATAATAGPPPLDLASPDDVRVLGLLAAFPGMALDVEQLSAISGVRGVQQRLLSWVARGLVTESDPGPRPGPRTYRLAAGVEPDARAWRLEERRTELSTWFSEWAEAHPDAELVAGGTAEPVRILQDHARRRRHWRSVLTLGALLGVSFAASGRWDAWHTAAQASLEAARALGDRAAEGLALHQLGTEALVRGDLEQARQVLSGSLSIRTAVGDRAGARVTRHNLDLIGVPPVVPPGQHHDGGGSLLGKVPTGVWVAGVALPVVGAIVAVLTLLGVPAGADVKLLPEAMDFSQQTVHLTSGPQTVHLENKGASTVHLEGVTVSGRDQAEFTVVGTTCVDAVPAGQGCDTTVTFTPTVAGSRQASLTWHVREVAAGAVSNLSGMGVDAGPVRMDVVPAALDFGDQAVNTLGPPHTVAVTAPMPAPPGLPSGPVDLRAASVDGVGAAEFVLANDGCGGVALRPGATCDVGVRFAPGRPGPRNAVLTLRDAVGRPVAAVPLSGAGTAAADAVTVTPASVAFGEQPIGTAAPTRTVTVTAHDALDLAGVTILGDAQFAKVGDDCPARLAPGASCSVRVVFIPARAGPQTAALLLQAPGRPAVPLSGVGTAATPVLPGMSPAELDFGAHAVQEVTAAQAVTITNRAAAPLRLGQPAVEGAAFRADASACTNVTLAPGASCRVLVSFAPTAPGAQTGVLAVTVAGAPGRAATRLSGTGTGTGTVDVAVPDVVGMGLPAARAALEKAGLRVGTTTLADGTVTDQTPVARLMVPSGTAVDLTLSRVVPPCNGTQAVVTASLVNAGLRVGTVTPKPDPQVPAGTVLSCTPAAGGPVPPGSAVDLVVSTGPVVPSCTGTEATVRAAIQTAGLRVGDVIRQVDKSAVGTVLGCRPTAGTAVDPGAGIVLVVSSGPVVPSCTGTEDAVRSAVTAAGLRVGTVTYRRSESPPGQAVGCSPATGTPVAPGSTVDIAVSAAVVPSCAGDAETVTAAVKTAGLHVTDTVRQTDKTAGGTVLSCRPGTGTPLKPGSGVVLTVSSGPVVPDCTGTEDTVKAALAAAGLHVGRISYEKAGATPGQVIRCAPATGTPVAPGSTVDLVESGVVVPDCTGKAAAVNAALTGLGLQPTDGGQEPSTQIRARDVVKCNPGTGTAVGPGSGVAVIVSSGPTPG